MRRRTVTAALAAAALAAAVVAAASTSNAAPKPAPAVVNSPTLSAASASYWTPARMRAAKPYPMPVVKTGSRPTAAQLVATGAPQSVAGSGATAAAAPFRAPLNPATIQPAGFTYPFPFVRFPVYPASLMNIYPWSVNGKLFFTQNGGGFVCSASSVVAPSRVRVWTAGHCVSDGAGHFDSNAVFVPAYNNGSAPFGVFAANSFTTTTAWHFSRDFSRDLGAMRVGANGAGQTLATAVGTTGFAWNQARDQEWTIIAYPAAPPFNGLIPWENHAATATSVNVGSGPAAIGIGSDFTGGSSGGAWRKNAGGAYVGWTNGQVDFKFGSQPLAIYSPYFDTLANAVRCAGETTGSLGC